MSTLLSSNWFECNGVLTVSRSTNRVQNKRKQPFTISRVEPPKEVNSEHSVQQRHSWLQILLIAVSDTHRALARLECATTSNENKICAHLANRCRSIEISYCWGCTGTGWGEAPQPRTKWNGRTINLLSFLCQFASRKIQPKQTEPKVKESTNARQSWATQPRSISNVIEWNAQRK